MQNEIDDRLHDARPAWAAPVAVVPLGSHQFPVPSQKRVRRDQGFKLVQHLSPECLSFSGESTAFGIGETNAPPTQALLEHAVLFQEILDHIKLMAVDPTGEHQEEHLKMRKQRGHAAEYIGRSDTCPIVREAVFADHRYAGGRKALNL